MLQSDQLPGEFVLSVYGEFGAPEVKSIKDILLGLTPGARVVLDFSRAERMQEFAIASMAEVLEERKETAIRVCGLSRHYERILAYLGAPLAPGSKSRSADDS